jgi:hypothetical protein
MKKVILFVVFIAAVIAVPAQKSVIDLFLEQNQEVAQQSTCVNITDEMLKMCYEHSSLTPPERYQSLSLCNAPSMLNRFEQSAAFKKYNSLMEIKKDDGRIIRYFQCTQDKKGVIKREIIVCTQYRNDFSVIYLQGDNISTQSLNQHLELIRSFIEKNKNINTYN